MCYPYSPLFVPPSLSLIVSGLLAVKVGTVYRDGTRTGTRAIFHSSPEIFRNVYRCWFLYPDLPSCRNMNYSRPLFQFHHLRVREPCPTLAPLPPSRIPLSVHARPILSPMYKNISSFTTAVRFYGFVEILPVSPIV